MKTLLLVALLGCLACAFAEKVRWCVTSDKENAKCLDLVKAAPDFACERRASVVECLTAIQASEADAITLDGGDIYTAGLDNYNLHPIIAEKYPDSKSCYYAVAVVKKGTQFNFDDLKGKKSCHTGLGKSAGWNMPIGNLLSKKLINWQGSDVSRLEDAVRAFFGASCVPGAQGDTGLCELCAGDCSKTSSEPYYNYDGAFKCLEDGKGEVAFVNHLTVPADQADRYELLCLDNRRAAIGSFETCNLARVPAHAVVTRKDERLTDLIWNHLNAVENFNLFSSAKYPDAKNLMFKDSAIGLSRIPPRTDSFMYLGAKYLNIVQSLRKVTTPTTTAKAMKWCVVGNAEALKCDTWSFNTNTTMRCIKAESAEDCLQKIMRSEADVAAVDGGQVYTAGKCGLVAAMVEQYDEAQCSNPQATGSHYYAVAVIKKDSGLTWDTLKGKKSCHTGIGRSAGWNIPMGRIHEKSKTCDFEHYFSESCAPGANITSPLCALCIGNEASLFKCKPRDEERYNGYNGAFRCLAEGAGEVAFIKHSVVLDNTAGSGRPQWAQNLIADDYRLICPDKGPKSVNEYESCHLAKVTAHAVVTRPEKRDEVVQFLKDQQADFGVNDGSFSMFKSEESKNLLFKDSTKCLQEIPKGISVGQFLGEDYMKVMTKLRECDEFTSAMEKSCSFNACQG
ncbi:transferrin-a [Solea solea]|uniref:transferrin-a n=1 Tax=Solea solea TaxID=90069 RepID=UPI00272CE1E6|nr:transferrin-a [Solea solea]